MAKGKLFFSGKRLMERWDIYSTELAARIYEGLPALHMKEGKFIHVPPEEVNNFDMNHMTDFVFDPDDVLTFEKEHGLSPIKEPESNGVEFTAEDARQFGMLKRQKHKLNASIVAAVQIGIYCADTDHRITRDEMGDLIYKIDSDISKSIYELIWQALPDQMKQGPGRPKKE
jgi:hypothetical protein